MVNYNIPKTSKVYNTQHNNKTHMHNQVYILKTNKICTSCIHIQTTKLRTKYKVYFNNKMIII